MIRQLSEIEINSVLNEKSINKPVVKDFLSTIHQYKTLLEVVEKLQQEASKKKINPNTYNAIRKGISIAMKK